MARDPVCGMEVSQGQAPQASQYQGQTYEFCSADCKQTFDKNPEQYTGQQAAKPQQ